MTTAFCNLCQDVRMAHRRAIEGAGGLVVGYDAETVQVALPVRAAEFWTEMEGRGLLMIEESLCYFALGSDNPPDSLRHDGKYRGSKGFWLYARFKPV